MEQNPKLSRSASSLERFKVDLNDEEWSADRKFVASVLAHTWFDIGLAIMVISSLVLAILGTDSKARNAEVPSWADHFEHVLLAFYILEMILRIYVFRREFIKLPLNLVDSSIVVIDASFFLIRLASVELPQVTFLRVLRLLKLTRAFHILAVQPELYILMEGFLGSIKTIFFGSFFIAVALVIYGILAVEFLYPLEVEFASTCSRCPYAFDSVYNSMLTIVETTIVGDSWGLIFLPYLEDYPLTLMIIIPLLAIVHFGLMNLIMAVIVDSAHQARRQNERERANERDRDFERNKNRLHKICCEMDTDQSGTITLDELLTGYSENLEFRRCMISMDIKEEDITSVFDILDEDESGDCEYGEFVQQLYRMKSDDSHTMLVFIKHYVTELRKKIFQELLSTSEQVATGMKELQSNVVMELDAMREIFARCQEAMEQRAESTTAKQIKSNFWAEEKLLTVNDSPTLQAVTPAVTVATASLSKANLPMQAEALSVEGQLRNVTDQVALVLEDLRQNCETSMSLIATLKGILPRATNDSAPTNSYAVLSLRNAAHGVEVGGSMSIETKHPVLAQDSKVNSTSYWQAKYCCTSPEMSQDQQRLPVQQ